MMNKYGMNKELLSSLMDQNSKRVETIICDWDAVIQLIEEPWFMNLLHIRKNNPTHNLALSIDFNKFTNNIGLVDLQKVVSRPSYYLSDWIPYDNEKLDRATFEEFMKLYSDDLSLYNRAPFLNMFYAVYKIATEKFCKELIFLSHTSSNDIEIDQRKQILFNKIFLDPKRAAKFNAKIKLVHLTPNQPKHDWIKKNKPDYTMFIDDRIDIIEGVIDNTESAGKTFCMPIMGYNVGMIARETHILDKLKTVEFVAYDQQVMMDLKPMEFFEEEEDIFLKFPF